MHNAFAHVELSTGNVKKAKKFYQSVFSWELRDMPEMNYTMIEVGNGSTGGGMMKSPTPKAMPAWLPYVQVEDVKATLAKAIAAGGQVRQDYMSIGNMGAIGCFQDPTGAVLGIWEKGAPAPEPAAKKSAKKAQAKPSAEATPSVSVEAEVAPKARKAAKAKAGSAKLSAVKAGAAVAAKAKSGKAAKAAKPVAAVAKPAKGKPAAAVAKPAKASAVAGIKQKPQRKPLKRR